MRDRKHIAALIGILILGLVLRVLWAVYVPTEQLYDFATYQLLAESIAAGRGHTIGGVPYAWQGCAYPYVLGVVYRVAGSTDTTYAYLLNIICSMGTLLCCSFIYKRLLGDGWLSLAALAVTALLPQYIAYVNVVGTEVFFTFLLSGIVCVQLYLGHRRISYPLLGALMGVAALTKPFMLAYPVICAIIQWGLRKNFKESLLLAAVSCLAMILIVSPWAYRNYHLFGRVITVSYNSGYVLQVNNNDNNINGAWMDLIQSMDGDETALSELESLMGDGNIKEAPAAESFLKDRAAGWIRSNPLEFIKLGVLRLEQTFFTGANDIFQWSANGFEIPDESAARNAHLRNMNLAEGICDVITLIINGSGVLFALSAAVRCVRGLFSRSRAVDAMTAVVFINLVFFAAITFVFEGQARYAFPVFLFMIPAAAYLYTALLKAGGKGIETRMDSRRGVNGAN